MSANKKVSEMIKNLRKEYNFSQEDLAKLL
jgi:transcriptional regulator with XRE-family HTH domain